MPGNRKQIAADGPHIDMHLAGALHRVHMEVDIRLGCNPAYLGDRLHHARLIVGHHDADQLGRGAESLPDLVRIDDSLGVHRQKRYLRSAIAELFGAEQHRMMLRRRS